jgi:benzoyl-CoA reductase/2-hydroxyglutaryl-CoA dehydratase subunit BcrC/BadD/HgdB
MMESVTREERLLEIITDRKIDGVIFYTQKFCDVSLFQIPLLREKIKSLGVLSLCLEGEFSDNISGQVRTRIQAFMEAIEFG